VSRLRQGAYFIQADQQKLWIELNAYETYLVWLRVGQRVSLPLSISGETISGTVSLIYPLVDPMSRT
jgi:multidrug resistance efflux pump